MDYLSKNELIVNALGQLIHIRSGQRVIQLEITGKDKRGKRVLMKFFPDQSGWIGFLGVNLYEGTRWIRLADQTRVKLQGVKN